VADAKNHKPMPYRCRNFPPTLQRPHWNGARRVPAAAAQVADGATFVTDQHAGYVGLQAGGYEHIRINHSVGELSATSAHTNGIESFWALLKRGHYGIFHYMSPKHLHRCVNEFAFRHNTARSGTIAIIDATIRKIDVPETPVAKAQSGAQENALAHFAPLGSDGDFHL
jgi:hypothetical protein